MRPFLDTLSGDAERERFTADYLAAIREGYPARDDGQVLFPFRRLFIVAYRWQSHFLGYAGWHACRRAARWQAR